MMRINSLATGVGEAYAVFEYGPSSAQMPPFNRLRNFKRTRSGTHIVNTIGPVSHVTEGSNMPKRRRNVKRRRTRKRGRRTRKRSSGRRLAISRSPQPKSVIKQFTQTVSFEIDPTAGNIAYHGKAYNRPGNLLGAAGGSIIQPRGWDMWQGLFDRYFCINADMQWTASYVDTATTQEAHQRGVVFGVLELKDQVITVPGSVAVGAAGNYVPEEFPCKKRYGLLTGLGSSRGRFKSRPGAPHGLRAKIGADDTVWCGTMDGETSTQPEKLSWHVFFAHSLHDAAHNAGKVHVQVTYKWLVKLYQRRDASLIQSID